ncbi:type 2 lanthipeptide synthetase LanM family protein [Herpetosiphon gulosus]|uniref:Lantibiotic biosynthesis protein dehydration domain-containing protein n=1 Tax=Herpetosiphon gulosus TaxID=1973496 RepID=A0ABP9X5M5_9CHLR
MTTQKQLGWGATLPLAIRRMHAAQCSDEPLNAANQRRFERWQAQTPFQDGDWFAQRLAQNQLTPEQLQQFLQTPAQQFEADQAQPDWVELFETVYRNPLPQALPYSTKLLQHPMHGLLYLVEPLLAYAVQQLHQQLNSIQPRQAFLQPDQWVTLWFESLAQRCMWMISRVTVLELHLARVQAQLSGTTPEERYHDFVQQLRDRQRAQHLLQAYPVLIQQLCLTIQRWHANSTTIFERLNHDWPALQQLFPVLQQTDGLIGLQAGAGDVHAGGQSVVILSFANAKLVYKPRSLAIDQAFQELLHWVNQHSSMLPLRLLKVLDRHHYGWSEWVDHAMLSDSAAIERFYQRQGIYLALLYVLNASDFHHENIIAAGEDPMFIDLESLCGPQVHSDNQLENVFMANQVLTNSVLRVSLLPERFQARAGKTGIDISGLGTRDGQTSMDKMPLWVEAGTDTMRMTKQPVSLSGSQHSPIATVSAEQIGSYLNCVVSGFEAMYDFLLQHQAELQADTSPLAKLYGCTIRVIARHTAYYTKIYQESFHPDVLRDALDRDWLFDRLWFEVKYNQRLVELIPYEHRDLWQGDIPLFTTSVDSCDLWSSDGQRIADYLPRSGKMMVLERLHQLSSNDLANQVRLISFSFATMSASLHNSYRSNERYLLPTNVQPSHADWLLAACGVGDELLATALHNEHSITWIGLTQQLELQMVGLDFYDGLPGIIYFLAYLGAISGVERYTQAAERALQTLELLLEQQQATLTDVGAFVGWGGLSYLYWHLASLWQKPALLNKAETWLARIPQLLVNDTTFDLMAGAAGSLLVGLRIYAHTPSSELYASLLACGDHLLASSQAEAIGRSWQTITDAEQPALGGLAHGTAGIAWALIELAQLTNDQRYRACGLQALAYDNSLFVAEQQNWRDIRTAKTKGNQQTDDLVLCMAAWCHGASGIGISRLGMAQCLDDATIDHDLQQALSTTLKQGFGMNHSLCHGDFGNLALIQAAAKHYADQQLQAQAQTLASEIFASIQRGGYRCGVQYGAQPPGLMTGIAGIGYGLLQQAAPACVPSVTFLEAPTVCATTEPLLEVMGHDSD